MSMAFGEPYQPTFLWHALALQERSRGQQISASLEADLPLDTSPGLGERAEYGLTLGYGLRLSERIQINAWDQVAYIIVLILITVALIDFVSKRIRTRLIAGR